MIIKSENYSKLLNEKQLEAVTYFDSPLLILAGAGSGKTRVLTFKIAYIVNILKESPSSILAVTFTNKAASEMKERVREFLMFNSMDSMWVGTFHSMCVRMIKMHRKRAGLSNNFTIYDEADKKSVIKKILKEKNLQDSIDAKQMARIISNLKNKLIYPDIYEGMIENKNQEKIHEIYSHYEEILSKNNAFDFDSLLVEMIKIFKKDEDFKVYLQNKFKYILVDEYQDTNHVQYVLLKNLYSKNNHISVVGDDDQSIYGFRGAEIQNILDFDKDFLKTKMILLEQNYRSTKSILSLASTIISNNALRREKTLWTDSVKGEQVELIEASNEMEEAFCIAEKILKLKKNEDSSFKDIAILYRTNAQSRAFEEMLRKHNIPYNVIGGIKFFERKEVKDILSYLNIIINNDDDNSMLRIINTPRRGIGEQTIKKIQSLCREKGISIYKFIMNYLDECSFPEKAKKGLNELKMIFSEIKKYEDNAYNSVIKIIEATLYNDHLNLLNEIESISRRENLQELINSAKEFTESNKERHSLADYIDMISLYTDIDDYDGNDDKVMIMTIHNAKGLEFETVFITGLEEGLLPHMNSLEDILGIEEERRLFYVAVTRAKKKVILSYAMFRNWYGNNILRGMSSFLIQIPDTMFLRKKEPVLKTLKEKRTYMGRNTDDLKNEKIIKNQKILHPLLGEGMIVDIKGNGDDMIATIRFNTGIKKIYVKYANLTRK